MKLGEMVLKTVGVAIVIAPAAFLFGFLLRTIVVSYTAGYTLFGLW